jgi:hypothetical protein
MQNQPGCILLLLGVGQFGKRFSVSREKRGKRYMKKPSYDQGFFKVPKRRQKKPIPARIGKR